MSDYFHVPAQYAFPADSRRLEASFSCNLSNPTSAFQHLQYFTVSPNYTYIKKIERYFLADLTEYLVLLLPLAILAIHMMVASI